MSESLFSSDVQLWYTHLKESQNSLGSEVEKTLDVTFYAFKSIKICHISVYMYVYYNTQGSRRIQEYNLELFFRLRCRYAEGG